MTAEADRNKAQALNKRLDARLTSLNDSTERMAEKLMDRGVSEEVLALFFSMHQVVNQLADADAICLRDPEMVKAYFTAVLDSLLCLTGGLTNGVAADIIANQLAVANNAGELATGVRELLGKISGARIGEPAMSAMSHQL